MPFLIPHPNLIQNSISNPSPITATILVVIDAILEVFFLCLVGWILAKKGIVDSSAKKVLNKLNVTLFTPALLFSKVAFSLSPKLLKELAIIPIGFGLITCLSALIAFLMGTMFGLKKGQKSFAIACAMFQNSNSLPIALMQSLIGEKMPLKWGEEDTKDQMLGRALSYLVLFSTLGIIIRWSIGVRLLTSAESDPVDSSGEESEDEEDEERLNRGRRRLDSDVDEEEGESRYYSSISNNNLENTPLIIGEVPPSSKTRKSLKKNPSSISFSTTTDDTLYNQPTTTTTTTSTKHNNNDNSKIDQTAAEEALTASQIQLLGSIKAGGVLGGVKPNPYRKNSLSHQHCQVTKNLKSSTSNTNENRNLKKDKKRPQSIFQSFPNTPLPSNRNSLYNSEEEESESERETSRLLAGEDEEWGAERGIGNTTRKETWLGDLWSERFNYVGRKLNKVWKPIGKFFKRVGDFMTVPLWAAVLSLVVACIPPLQSGLNQVEPLKAAIKTAGNCSVPITLVTLGAYFYRPNLTTESTKSRKNSLSSPNSPTTTSTSFLNRINPFSPKSPTTTFQNNLINSQNNNRNKDRNVSRRAEGETLTVLVAVLTRMILVPIILLPLFGWYCSYTNNVADDPIFVVVACLLIGSPTAITLAQITSSASGEVFEILISRTLFVSYAIMTAPCTIALVMTALYIDRNQ